MEEKLMSLAEQSFWVACDTTLGPSPGWLGWVPECDADTPPSRQQELKAMTLIACHLKHVTIWLFLCLKTKPLAFPLTGQEFSDREDREDMIRVLKKLLDHDSPGVPEPSSNDDHDGACPDAYLMRTPFKVWCFFSRGCSGWSYFRVYFSFTMRFGRWRLAFSRKPSGGIFGGLPSTMQELEPIWWRRVEIWEMLGDSPTPYFRWIWALALLCSMLCPLLIRSRLLQSHFKMPELREVSTATPLKITTCGCGPSKIGCLEYEICGSRSNTPWFCWGFFHSICAVAPAVTAYQWHWWDAAVQGGVKKIASFLGRVSAGCQLTPWLWLPRKS